LRNKTNKTYKMIILGSYAVGKTSLVDRLVYNEFKENETTIGASFNCIMHSGETYQYNLHIWDTAGQERYRSISQIYYKNTDICMMVYNMNNIESLIDIDNYWIDNFHKNNYATEDSNISLFIVGNMADIYNAQHNLSTDRHMRDILEKIQIKYPHIKFFEISAKSGYGMERLYECIFEDIDAKIASFLKPPEPEEDYFADPITTLKTRSQCC